MNNLNSLWYLIPAVLILILICPIFLELRLSVNPLFNRAVIALFVYKKQIFYFIVSYHGKYIQLRNENETKKQSIEFSSPEFEEMKVFSSEIQDKIRLKKFYIFYHIGTGDAMTSALVCGLLNQICLQTFVQIKNKKPTASCCVYDTVSYNKVCCEVACRTLISISLFEIAYSFIYSVILTKRK